MSAALNAAKKRRGVPPTPPTPQFSQPVQQQAAPQPVGLTLQQVVQVIDRRLIALEDFARKNANMTSTIEKMATASGTEVPNVPNNLTEVLEEYDSRFDILAEEIANMKNIVLSLQSYTMEVNKVLMKERIQILSGEGMNAEQVDAETATEFETTSGVGNLTIGSQTFGNTDNGETFSFSAN